MKSLHLHPAVLPLLFAAFIMGGCRTERYRLVWQENFEGTTFDTTVWSKIPRGTSDWNNFMSDYDSCYALRNGTLVLRGVCNTALPGDTAPYLTGGLYTKGKRGFSIGRIEICAKLGNARGAWPAFWMLPQEGRWPYGGEIDIMERLNSDTIAYQTVHSKYTQVLGNKSNPNHSAINAIDKDEFNVYAVEIHADSLCFFINDRHTFTYPRLKDEKAAADGQYPFTDTPFYLLLDMQLGGNWVGRVEPADLPVEMEIDWVKEYRFK